MWVGHTNSRTPVVRSRTHHSNPSLDYKSNIVSLMYIIYITIEYNQPLYNFLQIVSRLWEHTLNHKKQWFHKNVLSLRFILSRWAWCFWGPAVAGSGGFSVPICLGQNHEGPLLLGLTSDREGQGPGRSKANRLGRLDHVSIIFNIFHMLH